MTTQNVSDLFGDAVDAGDISSDVADMLNVQDLGENIQAGLGMDVDDVEASDVVLVGMMPDDSYSMVDMAQEARDGCNLVLEALKDSKQQDGVLITNRYLNGYVLYPYTTLDQAIVMDSSNYTPNMGTPLYDQTVIFLGTVLAKTQSFAQNGVPCRSVSLIISDGADQASQAHDAASVCKVVKDMLRTENHIIAAMGIDDGYTDFKKVFREMGIPEDWILTPKKSQSEIRSAFQVFSQSAVRASQSGKSFTQTAMGGFGS